MCGWPKERETHMNESLKEKIEQFQRTLREQSVDELMRFDVKDGEEDGIPYHKAYLEKTAELMGDVFSQREWGKLTPWEKLCCYKVSGGAGVDCDAALRSNVIYQLAFGGGGIEQYKDGHYVLKPLKDGMPALRGDTMNSYATTVRTYIREIWLPEHKPEMGDEGKKIITETGGGWKVSKTYREISKKNYWDAAILAEYDYFKDILPPAAGEFFRLKHTVGNFIAWPDGCNRPRGTGPVKDYWDLTLNCIHQWYQDNKNNKRLSLPKNDALLELFGSKLVIFHNWLAAFGTWDEFVRKNYMQAFVWGEDGKEDGEKVPDGGHFGPPKELWGDHFDGRALPQEPEHFEQFFANASAWIAARGIRIAQAVKAALAVKETEPEAVGAERG